MKLQPGSLVRCRNRDWVLLPRQREGSIALRPLTGATDTVVEIHEGLAEILQNSLPGEAISSTTFPEPSVSDLTNAAGAHLLWQAARLTLREGAAPFRSLGRISIRPRVYQFVPLLMALRLDPVRLLIADDVGVGKTIEALLIARELLDRGEVKRLCVLCPPYLCDQWQKELAEKFNLDAVVIRSGTVSQLERRKVGQESIYTYYPIQVISIDFVKSERNRHLFLTDCPELVIVDEAHGAAAAGERDRVQHQRHELVRELASDTKRHLILLTATPHSGIADSFRSLLSLLRPDFGGWDTTALSEPQRIELAKHLVQRTRADIERDWEGERCFPKRQSSDETYALSPKYRELFDQTYDFCSEIVQSGQSLDRRRQRVRYWGALALLRCVMSSPASARLALAARRSKLDVSEEDADYSAFVFESGDEQTEDGPPTPPIESAEATLTEGEKRRLRRLEKLAEDLHSSDGDSKITRCADIVEKLLREGLHPIVWCRYIATADYVADRLQKLLVKSHRDVRVVPITGKMGDDERRAKIDELSAEPCRVLVATDCLSEGVNLQRGFSAVIHYDLPWNPNRLEQREGRVDRFGQLAKVVRTIRIFSPDNAVDGVVLDVLLNKASEIHRTLGTHVPVPEESQTVTEAVLNALFLRRSRTGGLSGQMALDFGVPEVEALHAKWKRDADRESINRTRFAQRALKPDEVQRELEAVDAVLGDPSAVEEFMQTACQRLGLNLQKDSSRGVYRLALDVPGSCPFEAITAEIPQIRDKPWVISFQSPAPEGAEYVGRNHRFVTAVARYLFEESLTRPGQAIASRAGVIRTRRVQRLTTLLLLRIRYLLQLPERHPLLSEEVFVTACVGGSQPGSREWLTRDEAQRLLAEAQPDDNILMSEKQELLHAALQTLPALKRELQEHIKDRAAELEASHRRVRQAVSLRVRELKLVPQLPADVLGILVLQPLVGGGRP